MTKKAPAQWILCAERTPWLDLGPLVFRHAPLAIAHVHAYGRGAGLAGSGGHGFQALLCQMKCEVFGGGLRRHARYFTARRCARRGRKLPPMQVVC
jgi:hypothetical protein